jgi:hypothetical protein
VSSLLHVYYANDTIVVNVCMTIHVALRFSGHMVPLDKPVEALAMFSAFANHKSLDIVGGGGRSRGGGRGGPIPSTIIESIPDKRSKRKSFIRSRDRESNGRQLTGSDAWDIDTQRNASGSESKI